VMEDRIPLRTSFRHMVWQFLNFNSA